ncbi:MAG: hypothetical protein PHI32_06265 [Dysgonamonadaceae bacterium]|nr:hypothetical protein [Dysgonamonadaceae bacterium]MDD4727257.1 hypothetical protein [Dysgonamonadaceae bacterium]
MKPRIGTRYFTGQLDYEFRDSTATVKPKKNTPDILRVTEVWGLAYYNWLIKEQKQSVDKIVFDITPLNLKEHLVESFKRRISYLNLNNPFTLEIIDSFPVKLYSKDEIINRPEGEVVINKFKQRKPGGTSGRLEKDFQDFLNGESILRDSDDDFDQYKLIYRRLALLGDDFYNLEKNYKVIREVPTGVFKDDIKEKNRILPTFFVDFVAFNKKGELSLIELKLNDPKLHVISQLLDYALFAVSYKEQIIKMVLGHIGQQYCPESFDKKPIACYVANNWFHTKFDEISKYYSPDPKGFDLKFKKVVLGESITI